MIGPRWRDLLGFAFAAFLGPQALSAPHELKLERIVFADSALEISGTAWIDQQLVVVADNPGNHFLYAFRQSKDGNRADLKPMLDLSRLPGFSEYIRSLQNPARGIPKESRLLDVEGIATCGKDVYLIDERARGVLQVSAGKRVKELKIDFSKQPEVFNGSANAGFEGIALDCAGGKLFLAKEREGRKIYTIDLRTLKVLRSDDIQASNRSGQKVIHPFNGGDGLFTIDSDFADLYFENGYLYALERNTYEIAKVDPKSMKVIDRVSYYRTERGLYVSGEPFGLAEALTMTRSAIQVGIDNNLFPLSPQAQEKHGISGNPSAFLYFQRPAGF